jgi:dolichol-phosphate mannosyltransferase
MQNITIVIPVYNEGQLIEKTYQHLVNALEHKLTWTALFIYDFPEDTTLPFLLKLQQQDPRVVPLQQNLGKGVVNALKFGLKQATSDAVAVVMGDNSDDLENLPLMYEKFLAGASVVASSRYSKGGKYLGGSFIKKNLAKLAGFILNKFGINTKDPTNNFKLYANDFLKKIIIESTGGFEIALELTVKAALLGLKIDEVPGTWADREANQSKFKLVKWLPYYLKWFFHYLLNRKKT